MINFWFVECHPCIAELPALNKLAEEYKDNSVVFLAPTYETKQWLDTFFYTKYKYDFMIIPDAINVINQFGGTGYPTTYIIDRKGKLKEVFNGGPIDIKAETEIYLKAKPIIDELLKAE